VKHKRIIICLSVVVAIAAGVTFKFQKSQVRAKETPPSQQQQAIPEFEVYRMLFHHHVSMKKKADELEKQGKDAKFLREFYKREAKLTDDQASAFDEIATKCEEEIAKQDAKAQAIIDKVLAKNGNGKLAKGVQPPETPPELRTLWDERNAIIMKYRYGLEAAFGGSEFKRFADYVNRDVVPHIVAAPNQPRPTPMGPRHMPKISKYPPSPEER
jgi:hypothetical protein